jgi:hypothetical protein
LEKHVHALLLSVNRKIIEAKQIEQFKKDIITSIKKLEEKNVRCNSLNAFFTESHSSERHKDLMLYIPGICNFHIYQSLS